MDSLVGKLAGEYRLLARIGHGGMSVVYRGLRQGSTDSYAVKILSPAAAETGQFALRFQREAAVLTRLRHPRIVPVIDFGEVDGRPFLVMPLVEGGSLGERLAQGPLDPRQGGRLLDQVADGLGYAHGQGVVHRDIKPSNILLDANGDAQLSDFGLAMIHDASVSLTGSALIGTPSYMSPEQARGATVDARTDQYSLGIVLYELTTGRLPFVADTPMAVVVKHMQEPLPLPRAVNPSVPLGVERVILKATAKDPAERFPDVRAMNQAFQGALAHALSPSGAAPPLIPIPPSSQATVRLPPEASGRPSRPRRRAISWLIAAGLLAATLCIVGGVAALGGAGVLGGRGQNPGAVGLHESPDAPDPALQTTISALSTALAGQQDAGPDETALWSSLLGTLTALPTQGRPPAAGTGTPEVTLTLGTTPDPGLLLAVPSSTNTPRPSSTPPPSFVPTKTRTPSPSWTTAPTSTSAAATSAGPTAVPTAVPTTAIPTISPSNTSVPTTPAPPTTPPTATATEEPPPVADPCETTGLGNPDIGFLSFRIDVENSGDNEIQITALQFDWPEQRDELERIRLEGDTIWDQGDHHPPTSIDPSEWRSGASRDIGPGDEDTLSFVFQRPSGSSDYSLELTLNGECNISW